MHSPADFYGNVKVPDLAQLKNHTEEDEDWTHVASDKTVYSSVLGVPVSGVPTTRNTTFTIENSYYYVTCENVTQGCLQPFWVIEPGHAISHSPIYNGPFSETNITFGLDTMGGLSVSTAGLQVCESSMESCMYLWNMRSLSFYEYITTQEAKTNGDLATRKKSGQMSGKN